MAAEISDIVITVWATGSNCWLPKRNALIQIATKARHIDTERIVACWILLTQQSHSRTYGFLSRVTWLTVLRLAYGGELNMGQIDIDGICLPLCTSDGHVWTGCFLPFPVFGVCGWWYSNAWKLYKTTAFISGLPSIAWCCPMCDRFSLCAHRFSESTKTGKAWGNSARLTELRRILPYRDIVYMVEQMY